MVPGGDSDNALPTGKEMGQLFCARNAKFEEERVPLSSSGPLVTEHTHRVSCTGTMLSRLDAIVSRRQRWQWNHHTIQGEI